MCYYQFKRQEILQKAKEKYSKEKNDEHYFQNKDAIKKSQNIDTKTCQKKKKRRLKSAKEKGIQNWFSTKKKCYKINNFCFFLSMIRISEKTLKVDNIRANKKELRKFKQSIDLLNVDQIVVSDKFKHSDDGFKYFICYKDGKVVKPLCNLT